MNKIPFYQNTTEMREWVSTLIELGKIKYCSRTSLFYEYNKELISAIYDATDADDISWVVNQKMQIIKTKEKIFDIYWLSRNVSLLTRIQYKFNLYGLFIIILLILIGTLSWFYYF
tara:strand:+ start:468 stop:815 length:348 start_codon:yes stop_codon:yes gene_type:complete